MNSWRKAEERLHWPLLSCPFSAAVEKLQAVPLQALVQIFLKPCKATRVGSGNPNRFASLRLYVAHKEPWPFIAAPKRRWTRPAQARVSGGDTLVSILAIKPSGVVKPADPLRCRRIYDPPWKTLMIYFQKSLLFLKPLSYSNQVTWWYKVNMDKMSFCWLREGRAKNVDLLGPAH